ncbi:hypothetical protein EJB05_06272, partial [Eragrostis curvula]
MDPMNPSPSSASSPVHVTKYSRYLNRKASASGSNNTIQGILNGVIKEKLKIIPKDLVRSTSSNILSRSDQRLKNLDVPSKIDELLAHGVDVPVYNRQLDVICSTIGAESWVQKLKWDGLSSFLSAPRQPLYCGPTKATKAFVRSYKNLHFYWILGSGHFVPYEQPCIALSMIGSITQSPGS